MILEEMTSEMWGSIRAVARAYRYTDLKLIKVIAYDKGDVFIPGGEVTGWELRCTYPTADRQGVIGMPTVFRAPTILDLVSAMGKPPRDYRERPR